MKKYFTVFIFLFLVLVAQAQLLSTGTKFDEKFMFHAALNYPLFLDKEKPFDFYAGLDFTTKNNEVPSGLAPQLGFAYYLVDDKAKDFLISANLNAGYLFDFNKEFDNQFRVTPHLYFELLSLLNLRVGYEYLMPFNKGFPFVSIGIGGGSMFRHLSIM